MKVYKVESTNIDVNDGIFDHGYFMHKHHAELVLKNHSMLYDGNHIVEDIEGKLETYQDKSLKYSPYHNKPAVYYRSHFGNYRMAVWIKEVNVQE